MESDAGKIPDSLNEYQAKHLRITCQHIDKVLGDVEGVLNAATSKAAFPRYCLDIAPAQRGTVEDYIARIRAQLTRVLEGQNIPGIGPSIPASRAIHAMLTEIDIVVEELKPKYMRGYGHLPECVATELNGIVGELGGLVSRLDRYLAESIGQDLKGRIERLEQAGSDPRLLQKIERAVRERGLIEFRSSIAAILDRAEDNSLEIAVFGRVSSGKSSLLNAILQTSALPVGVTPITAVPTRITYAQKPSLMVWFSETSPKMFEVEQIAEFATEQQNSANAKHVTRIVLALPSPRLKEGVVFVDTPGLGSLAMGGTAETLAYLPRCDLGIVLIDAGSALTSGDLQTITRLHQAAVSVNVLLSKADLLSSEDCIRIVQYVKEHLASDCKLNFAVHPVSALPSRREMLDNWFEREIVPLYARSQELRISSLRVKTGVLRSSVIAALKVRLKQGKYSSVKLKDQARSAEALLRKATGQIEVTRSLCERLIERARTTAPDAIAEASRRLLHAWSTGSYGVVVPGQLIRDSITQFVELQVRRLQREIATLAGQLGKDLSQCASYLRLSDAPSEGEFQSVIRGTPAFGPLQFNAVVHRPKFFRLMGRRIAERQLASQINRRLSREFYRTFEMYWRLIREWIDMVIEQLKYRFENYAERYRAQAEQVVVDRHVSAEEVQLLEQSLADLEGSEGSSQHEGDGDKRECSSASKQHLGIS